MFLVEQHHFGTSLELADALIAATALGHGLPLLTGNARHYQAIKNLVLKKFEA
jgi:predicted nucleic acid-binding protein